MREFGHLFSTLKFEEHGLDDNVGSDNLSGCSEGFGEGLIAHQLLWYHLEIPMKSTVNINFLKIDGWGKARLG